MLEEYMPNIQKSPTISAPFRRQLFEPCESSLCHPIVNRNLVAPPKNDFPPQPTPVIGSKGQELYRLSDVKKQIEAVIRQKEEEIRELYMKELTAELAIALNNQTADEPGGIKSNVLSQDDCLQYIYS